MLNQQEYDSFTELVKTYVELYILLRIIPIEMQLISHSGLKLSRSYYDVLNEIHHRVERDLPKIRKQIHRLGGQIISEKQEKSFRLVTSRLKGYIYEHRFSNDVLRGDCESLMARYMKGEWILSQLEEGG